MRLPLNEMKDGGAGAGRELSFPPSTPLPSPLIKRKDK